MFDARSKQRISRVYIYNTRSQKGIYNNSKGEFTTQVAQGDVLLAAIQGYGVDTIKIKSQAAIIFYLKPNGILLREVTIKDTLKNPKDKYAQAQKDYKDIYRKGDSKDLLNIGPGGVGLGIDAIWSLLSKQGKNARYLQKILERDYNESIINYRYTKPLVARVTGLSGERLQDFMEQYRPSYYFVLQANDYSFIEFIKTCYIRYEKAPLANKLPPLKP